MDEDLEDFVAESVNDEAVEPAAAHSALLPGLGGVLSVAPRGPVVRLWLVHTLSTLGRMASGPIRVRRRGAYTIRHLRISVKALWYRLRISVEALWY